MKVFVTGATGFVGSHLVEALLDRGDEVRCLVRDPAKANALFTIRRPHLVRGDLTDGGALRAACEGADVVFHLAGLTAARNLREFSHVNAGGTRVVLRAAEQAASGLQRFVYVSSLAAAGPTAMGHPLTEEDPARPVSDYGTSKLAGEEAVRESDLPTTVLRPPAVYGPRDVDLLRVFRLARTGLVPVFGDGSQELSFVHVTDLTRAQLAAVATPPGRTYFVCHPEIVTAREFGRRVVGAVQTARGRERREPRGTVAIPRPVARMLLAATGSVARLLGRRSILSSDKAKELLAEAWTCSPAALARDAGWRAEIPSEDGLAATAQWYRQHRWL